MTARRPESAERLKRSFWACPFENRLNYAAGEITAALGSTDEIHYCETSYDTEQENRMRTDCVGLIIPSIPFRCGRCHFVRATGCREAAPHHKMVRTDREMPFRLHDWGRVIPLL